MSVYYQTIVVYGWNIGTEQYKQADEDDGWENELDEEYGWHDQSVGEIACIYDGRAGEYCYFGVVTDATNSTRDGAQSFDGEAVLDRPGVGTMMEVGAAIERFDLDVGEPEFHVFTHVT